MPKPYFPMFVDLSGKRALVVGAGKIAARRTRTLLAFCDDVTVVAPRMCPEIEAAGATLVRRAFAPGDLEGMDIVLACTDDHALNASIARMCRERGLPVNAASDKSLCDFYFPGVALRGDVAAGVTASGRDHRLAKRAAEAVQRALDGLEV